MHEVTQAVRLPNALFEVEVEGSKYNALVKHVQRDFVTRQIEHVDLLEVDSKQIVTVAVELKVEGETKPGSKAVVSVKTVEVHTPAGSIPRNVILDIDGSDIGAHFKIADIKFPDGVVSAVDDSRIIVAVKELAKKKETQIDVAGGGSDADAGASDAA
jgi:large subunit ribosomal protein L25